MRNDEIVEPVDDRLKPRRHRCLQSVVVDARKIASKTSEEHRVDALFSSGAGQVSGGRFRSHGDRTAQSPDGFSSLARVREATCGGAPAGQNIFDLSFARRREGETLLFRRFTAGVLPA